MSTAEKTGSDITKLIHQNMCDVWHCGPVVMQPRSQGLSSCGHVARAEEPGLTPGGAVLV